MNNKKPEQWSFPYPVKRKRQTFAHPYLVAANVTTKTDVRSGLCIARALELSTHCRITPLRSAGLHLPLPPAFYRFFVSYVVAWLVPELLFYVQFTRLWVYKETILNENSDKSGGRSFTVQMTPSLDDWRMRTPGSSGV